MKISIPKLEDSRIEVLYSFCGGYFSSYNGANEVCLSRLKHFLISCVNHNDPIEFEA